MFCRVCGTQLPDGVKFCSVCGTKVADSDARPWEEESLAAQEPALGQYVSDEAPAMTDSGEAVFYESAANSAEVAGLQPQESCDGTETAQNANADEKASLEPLTEGGILWSGTNEEPAIAENVPYESVHTEAASYQADAPYESVHTEAASYQADIPYASVPTEDTSYQAVGGGDTWYQTVTPAEYMGSSDTSEKRKKPKLRASQVIGRLFISLFTIIFATVLILVLSIRAFGEEKTVSRMLDKLDMDETIIEDETISERVYDELEKHYSKATKDNVKEMLSQLEIKDTLAPEIAGVMNYIITGKGDATLDIDRLVQIVEDNKELISETLGTEIEPSELRENFDLDKINRELEKTIGEDSNFDKFRGVSTSIFSDVAVIVLISILAFFFLLYLLTYLGKMGYAYRAFYGYSILLLLFTGGIEVVLLFFAEDLCANVSADAASLVPVLREPFVISSAKVLLASAAILLVGIVFGMIANAVRRKAE